MRAVDCILKAMFESSPMTVKEIAVKTGISESHVRMTLYTLEAQRKVSGIRAEKGVGRQFSLSATYRSLVS